MNRSHLPGLPPGSKPLPHRGTLRQALELSAVRMILAAQRLLLALGVRVAFGAQRGPRNPDEILVLRTGALGDFLFAVPALRLLRDTFPQARITLLTLESAQASIRSGVAKYAGNRKPWLDLVQPGLVDDVISIDSTTVAWIRSELRGRIRTRTSYMTFVLMNPGEQFTSIGRKLGFLYLAGVRGPVFGWRKRASTGFLRDAQYAGGLLTHKIIGALESACECELVRPPRDVVFGVVLPAAAVRAADAIWLERGWSNRTVVAIAPGSIQAHKQWPLPSYIEVARALLAERPDLSIVVTGTPADARLGEELVRAVEGDVVNLCGRTAIPESAAVLSKCALLLSNDGGAVHLATAVGCPVVTIGNGIEHPGVVDPWYDAAFVARATVDCSPCYSNTFCPKQHCGCVRGVQAAEVTRLARRRLGEGDY